MPASPTKTNDAIMKKNHAAEPAPAEMREHYDFDYSTSRPNRFASRPKLGRVRSVVLEPDVAEVFHSSDQVNELLRSIITNLPSRRAEKKPSKKRAS
jgi:hypothetical protein